MERRRSPLLDGTISDVKVLERHLKVLKAVMENEPIGIIKLSQKTGLPQHAVRYSLRVLEQEGLIEPSRSGAITTEKIHKTLGTIESTLDDLVTTLRDLKKEIR